jgi:hypothetical protein
MNTQAATKVDHIAATIEGLGLSVESEFVPFSRSRNHGEKVRNLNWRVTIKRNGRNVLTTDYSAGMAHCPSYKPHPTVDENKRIAFECEHGLSSRGGKPLAPKPADVIYSLVMDSGVLDAGGFEQWASEFGYDADSRKAEKIYRDCIDIALKLRAAIGDEGLSLLREAFQDY